MENFIKRWQVWENIIRLKIWKDGNRNYGKMKTIWKWEAGPSLIPA